MSQFERTERMNPDDAAPAVDLMALLDRCLGNFKMVERVLATFRDTGWSDLIQLQTAAEVSDFQAASEISHRFKGAASNVSATRLRELLIQAEQLGHDQNSAGLTSVLGELRSEWDAFKRYAQVFAPTADASPQGLIRPSLKKSETQHAGAGC